MHILGINAYHGDASAAILRDGQLLAAVEEERFTRVKHTAGFPIHAIRYCLDMAGVGIEEVDHIAVPRDPRARLLRKISYAVRLPRFALERARVFGRFGSIPDELARAFDVDRARIKAQVHRVEHHRAHLASSFFVSPFDRAAVLSLDGLGDFASGMWGIGEGNRIKILGSVAFPHSVGMFYTALTQYLGFWKYGDEYKVMGLASYGEPEFLDRMRDVLRLGSGTGYTLNMRYFTHNRVGPSTSWESGEPVLGRLFSEGLEEALGPSRRKEEEILSRHENVAATMQARAEEAVIHQWNTLYGETGLPSLAYAGGVAFNCVANGKIFQKTPFQDLYVQSAAGDAGLAIGAAFSVWHETLENERSFVMDHAYWGPEFSEGEIRRTLEDRGLAFSRLEPEALVEEAARHIAMGKVVGWYQGRMEWGPRALGNRSIVADPRRPEMRDILNRRIKHREPFRPFAPSILEEYTGEYFDEAYPSPFMLMAYMVKPEKRDEIPAPMHVDGTGRLQTVNRNANPDYWNLIDAFRRETGVPVVLNTSLNENEPVVRTPEEAVDCFLRTRMDVLAIGPFLLERGERQ